MCLLQLTDIDCSDLDTVNTFTFVLSGDIYSTFKLDPSAGGDTKDRQLIVTKGKTCNELRTIPNNQTLNLFNTYIIH